MTQAYRCLVIFKVTSKSHKPKKPSFLPLSIRHWLHLYLGRQPCWRVDVFTGFFGEVASLKNTWVGLQERQGQSETPSKSTGPTFRCRPSLCNFPQAAVRGKPGMRSLLTLFFSLCLDFLFSFDRPDFLCVAMGWLLLLLVSPFTR